ncbi:hypothetical protein [Paraburkholderia xenovorans]|uniref:hypothetical protein n=1 Tax=Paraburkholderia xenovorans TaxID=36873 RepID=UPI001A061892|nr:hypothetical protein [Paraburkholderia xenovorans]NPT35285.1 hypothetical protein [Paraburkholderia xenovorans]
MIPLGAASTLLGGVTSAISSGLSMLTGKSSASESSQSSFAAHLKSATTSQSSSAKSVHHHHVPGAVGVVNAMASSSPIQTSASAGTTHGVAAGSIINISA